MQTDTKTGEVLDADGQGGELELRGRALRHPGIPTNVNELAARKGEAIEILEARILILETARARAIRMTSPEDWVLFKSPDSRITGYLQDAGCDRIRDILGIEVFDVSEPVRQTSADGQSFMYLVTGSGRSRLTLQSVEAIEGGRESTDDFCKGKNGAALELAVRKAARANLDGNITRELAGLKTVPLDELEKAWANTGKQWMHCRKGRGFGSAEERLGATRAGTPEVEPPVCPYCQPANTVKLKFREGRNGRPSFYGCPNYDKHPNDKIIVDAAEWVAKQQKNAPPTAAQNGGGNAQ